MAAAERTTGMSTEPVRAAGTPSIETRHLRDVLGSFTTGVVVITTTDLDGRPLGLTVNSFNAVSLDPALVLWSLALRSRSLPVFRAQDLFAVNILAEDQEQLCRQFATAREDRFADVGFEPGETGVPLLHGTAAHIECRTIARHAGGDHEIMIGEVLALGDRGHAPLVVHRGAIRRLNNH